MAKQTKIAERVSVARRYTRSVDLQRDLGDPNALDGYVLTGSARYALERLAKGLSSDSTQRAFRIVGPYGSGKSSFALFLANLIGNQDIASLGGADGDHPLAVGKAIGFQDHHVLVLSGSRVSLTEDLASASLELAKELDLPDVEKLLAQPRAGVSPGQRVKIVLRALEIASADIREKYSKRLLLIIDEMGRYVEHAALDKNEDASIFQRLAELAGGKSAPELSVLIMMHHRFGDYIAGLGQAAEAEWTRSAERYDEIAFGDGLDQAVHLLANALQADDGNEKAMASNMRTVWTQAAKRQIFSFGEKEAAAISARLYPFHPSTVACLHHLVRRFAQNDRSLFGFLQSDELHGFQRFIRETRYSPDTLLRLPNLFDYMAAQNWRDFGSADRAQRWSRALDALGAIDGSKDDIDVFKSAAVLSVLEPIAGISPVANDLGWCLNLGSDAVAKSLNKLTVAGFLYHRPQSGDYSLWSRTSVNLSSLYEEASIKVPLIERLNLRDVPLAARPLLAQAHYHRTGSMRTFGMALVGENAENVQIPDGLDGVVGLVLRYPGQDRKIILRQAKSVSEQSDAATVVMVQDVDPSLLDKVTEHARWMHILETCDELRVDDVARSEVTARMDEAATILTHAIGVEAMTGQEAWFHCGEPVDIPDRTALSKLTSQICETIYPDSPVLRNELINRGKLSTAIASARTRLIQRMISDGDKEMLGMEGAPPERTIYLAMFANSSIHRNRGEGEFSFGPPDTGARGNWSAAWEVCRNAVIAPEPLSLQDLLNELGRPPIGLREAPAFLLIVAFLIHGREQVAVMERGTFIPEVTDAHLLRASKKPANFTLQQMDETGGQDSILAALASKLKHVLGGVKLTPEIKPITEAIFTWFGNLDQAAKITSAVSIRAQDVRTALAKTHDPIELLFRRLPSACGFTDKEAGQDPEEYGELLADALQEIDDHTERQRRLATAALCDAFNENDLTSLRDQIERDFERWRTRLTDFELRQFVDRALSPQHDLDRWLDGVAGLIAGRRIENWEDTSFDLFAFKAREFNDRLLRWLFLARRSEGAASTSISMHLVHTDGTEVSKVVNAKDADEEMVRELQARLEDAANPEAILMLVFKGILDKVPSKENT